MKLLTATALFVGLLCLCCAVPAQESSVENEVDEVAQEMDAKEDSLQEMGEGEDSLKEMGDDSKQVGSELLDRASEASENSLKSESLPLLHGRPGLVVSIESVQHPGLRLRLDGRGVNSYNIYGAGRVAGWFGVGNWRKFILRPYGRDEYAIESLAFPNVYLRMGKHTATGTRRVNARYGIGPSAKFIIKQVAPQQYTISSAAHPGWYLHMFIDSVDGREGYNVHRKFKINVL